MLPDYIKQKIFNKDFFVLVGDFIEDIHMVSPKDLYRTFCFGFLEKNVEENLNFYKDAFDVVLTDYASFTDVSNIIENLIDKKVN